MNKVLSFVAALVLLALTANVSSQVLHKVPGYATLNGTEDTSIYGRTYYGFRGVFYADMPTSETRFLVRNNLSFIFITIQ